MLQAHKMTFRKEPPSNFCHSILIRTNSFWKSIFGFVYEHITNIDCEVVFRIFMFYTFGK